MLVLFHPVFAQEVNNVEIKIETNSGLTYVFRSDNVNCEQRLGAYEYPQNTWCSASGYTLDLTDSKKPYTKWQMCAVTPAYLAPPQYANLNTVTCIAANRFSKLPQLTD